MKQQSRNQQQQTNRRGNMNQVGTGRSEGNHGNDAGDQVDQQMPYQPSWQRRGEEFPYGQQQGSQFSNPRGESARQESTSHYQSQGQQGQRFDAANDRGQYGGSNSRAGDYGSSNSQASYELRDQGYGTGAGRQGSMYGEGSHQSMGMPPMHQGGEYSHGYRGKGPKNYKLTDEKIQDKLSEKLYEADDIDASNITVKVQEGEVTLEGFVDSRETKRATEDLAEKMSGVQEVINHLRVAKNSNQEKSSKETKTEEVGSLSPIQGESHLYGQKKRVGER